MSAPTILFADKPAGVTTHTSLGPDDGSHPIVDRADGLAEMLQDRLGEPLYVVHRLDRETTGALALARTAEAAEQLREIFATRKVQKTYLFLTDRKSERSEHHVESFIEKREKEYVSLEPTETQPANAVTNLRLRAESDGFYLWEAQPETGRTHQIRLHAAGSGIPILGDQLYGGSAFPALCLHSQKIAFSLDKEEHQYESPAPRWFENRSLIKDEFKAQWLASIDRRERLLRSWASIGADDPGEQRTLRWIHWEGDPLRAEQLGPVHALSWFREQDPADYEWESIRSLAAELGWKNWYLQIRENRGRAPNESLLRPGAGEVPSRWQARENDLTFEFRTDSGLSAGLFLDQRRNRRWVRENASGKTLLNLFCYTGGFSVAAAAGGSMKTVSVDLSKTFLEWAKANFALNGLSIEGHEFRAMDSREYLAWAKKKGLKFDLVVCDPPSFSRSKTGVFQIEKEFASLLDALLDVTAPKGRVLFASNFESWDLADFAKRANETIKRRGGQYDLLPTPSADWDFELPLKRKNMKSFFVTSR